MPWEQGYSRNMAATEPGYTGNRDVLGSGYTSNRDALGTRGAIFTLSLLVLRMVALFLLGDCIF